MSGLYSEKTGRTYDAEVILDDTGGKYVNFKLKFPVKKGRRKIAIEKPLNMAVITSRPYENFTKKERRLFRHIETAGK